jgi:hypothetical protein
LQETWLPFDLNLNDALCTSDKDILVLLNGNVAQNGCVYHGVGIVLSAIAQKHFRDSGSIVLRFGKRIICVMLKVQDNKGRCLSLCLASAYFPTTSTSRLEINSFYDDLQRLFDSIDGHTILMVGADVNAAVGLRDSRIHI